MFRSKNKKDTTVIRSSISLYDQGLSGTGYWCALGQAVTIATIACSLRLEKRDMAHKLHEDAQPIKVYYVKLRLECRGLSTMPKLSYNRSQLHPWLLWRSVTMRREMMFTEGAI